MRQTPGLSRFLVLVFTFFVAYPVQAQNAGTAADKREAQAWLKKIQAAAVKQSYSGTFVYQQGEQFRSSRITHVKLGKDEYEKLEVLDGKPREYIRTNNEIICYVPDTKTVLVEKRVTQEVFPALPNANPARISDHYRLSLGSIGRVAGYRTQAILLEPRDNLRYGYRLWAEQKTGLLLRAQTLNEKGDVVEQIAFTQIEIGKIERSRTRSSITNTQGWHIERAEMESTSLSGWSVKSMPPGFRKIREVKRLVTNATATSAKAGNHAPPREVAQMVYSDGLAAISIFIEPGSAGRTEGYMQQGAMNIAGKRQGEFWLTIVGEVPAVAIRQVVNSIEFKTR
ncbi:MucB/RseB C-terminal domain-containing protein [Janthinobacterium sp. 17J80-10]|uniref:MucB/RseB C-terminal domain-containing protein n=1 Tax=Janthinobacterium sp. 17J80-10 TaxID=2497863 RepID=UPI0010053E78|nr:MucB/RseB C-terminal domain-containing protein [Janthinobacterium sp. 17J80-10]QAU34251.1 transcriptional regulator [Janthinobacterium sp. 17J80-10]